MGVKTFLQQHFTKHGRHRRVHLLASVVGVLAGGLLAVSLVSPGESAQDPAAIRASSLTVNTEAFETRAGGTELKAVDGPRTVQTASLATAPQPTDTEPAARPAPTPEPVVVELPQPRRERLTIRNGDTLMVVLQKAGLQRTVAYHAISALSKVHDPRRIRPGMELTLTFAPKDDAGDEALDSVTLHASVEEDFVARRTAEGFAAETVAHPLEVRIHRAAARIDDSLYLAAKRAKVPAQVIVQLIQLYSFDVDFQRDIQPGDSFEVLFTAHYTAEGELARYGDIDYARLNVRDTELPLYRFEMADGGTDYFNDKGHSVRKALMKTPVDGARLSSRFGMRKHPILGYRKSHRGIDFAAPSGTPIMAAGNGTVEMARRNGAYGKYIRIRHNSEYKTAYAHMSGYGRGIREGVRVRQGQIIGYIGSTGRSTGPHLHYEVLHNNQRINPLGLKLPSGRQLKSKELAEFQSTRLSTDKLLASTPLLVEVAAAE
jgi:murein DD-endopeptidase MepM/ murein hydrolase activator NlpD